MNNLIPILIVIFLSAFGVLGDYFMKISGSGIKYINYPLFLLGMSIYILGGIGWFFVMKHIKLSTLGMFFALTNIILLVSVGVFFFKERLNIYEVIGIILGVISIFILARFA
jgi:drug/metabolite transporter (DMT)-like permease